MKQEEVLLLAVEAIEALGLRYMIAGSYASNFHGVPRMTHDADVVVELEERSAPDLARALAAHFYVSEEDARDAARLRRMFNAIHVESGLEVDLVVKKQRPFSAVELERRRLGMLAGRDVAHASVEDTILTKLEWALPGTRSGSSWTRQGSHACTGIGWIVTTSSAGASSLESPSCSRELGKASRLAGEGAPGGRWRRAQRAGASSASSSRA